jgi:hypothetical protein
MHRSDKNVDKIQDTVYSDMVIWSTRLYLYKYWQGYMKL